MVTPRRNNGSLTFGCTCPGCGAELEFRNSLWVTTCTHCETPLRIVMPDGVAAWMVRPTKPISQIRFFIDRHFREQGLNPPGNDLLLKQLYYPYWRIDGSLLKVRTRRDIRIYANESNYTADLEETTINRAVSLSPYFSAFSAGPSSSEIPDALGLRAGYLTLFPFTEQFRDPQYDVAPVTRPVSSMSARVQKGLDGLDSLEFSDPEAVTTKLLHPQFSLIYFPYVIGETYLSGSRRVVVDCVTGKLVADSTRSNDGVPSPDEEPIITNAHPIFVEPHRCATCGSPFDISRSLVYHCQSCQEWSMLGSCRELVKNVEWRTGQLDDTYFPFWAFQIPEDIQDDLTRLLGLVRRAEWLIVPAFATPNLEASYRLAKRITGSTLMNGDIIPANTQFNFQPVTMELTDATALADVVLLRSATDKQMPLPDVHFEPATARLVCLPFHAESYFWVDSLLGAVTVERAAVDG